MFPTIANNKENQSGPLPQANVKIVAITIIQGGGGGRNNIID
jgi:hypothetical protein